MILWENSIKDLITYIQLFVLLGCFSFISGDKHTVEIHIRFHLGKTKEHLLFIPQDYEIET